MKDEATEDGELRIALIGHRGGMGLREIADDLYGVARVAADWDADNWTRARTRRLVREGARPCPTLGTRWRGRGGGRRVTVRWCHPLAACEKAGALAFGGDARPQSLGERTRAARTVCGQWARAAD